MLTRLLLTSLLSIWGLLAAAQPTRRIILDADTGNEVDDLYAVSRALIEPSWNILALNATQWQSSQWAIPQTMEDSYRLNIVLARYLKPDVPQKRGGVSRMFDWGDKAQHSAAAYEIIKQAKVTPEGQKLTVVAIGALTNVASALYIDPTIEPKLTVYWLGTTYDFDKAVLGLTDFNAVMDIQATQHLLRSGVEMHIIPSNVASKMTFTYAETAAKLANVHPLGDVLVDRWKNHLDGGRISRVLWDLALIEAIIHPEWARETTIMLSKDNGNRPVSFYQMIDAAAMKNEFFSTLLKKLQN